MKKHYTLFAAIVIVAAMTPGPIILEAATVSMETSAVVMPAQATFVPTITVTGPLDGAGFWLTIPEATLATFDDYITEANTDGCSLIGYAREGHSALFVLDRPLGENDTAKIAGLRVLGLATSVEPGHVVLTVGLQDTRLTDAYTTETIVVQ